jgi:RHS repeat-associated protein
VNEKRQGATTTWHDAFNQLVKKTWPDGSVETFGYDAVGNQTSHQLTDGHTNTSTYDVMNRLTKLTYFDGTSVSYTYTPTGMPATVVDSRGTTSYSYDNQNRLIQITTPGGQTLNYTYDAAGNRTGMGTPAGTVSYTYDNDNQLASVTSQGVGTFNYSYDKVGNRTGLSLPNGIMVSYSYDALNRLISLTQTKSGQTLASYTYTLSPNGTRTKVVNADGSSVSWTYDNASRLTGETDQDQHGTTTFQASYAYDAVGNRTSATINGQTTTYTYNTLDQLTSAGSTQYSYDGRGNLTTVTNGTSVTTYSYDAADRLVSATEPNGTSASYVYDADGRQVQQTIGSSVTNYLWDEASANGDVVQETDGSGATQASYVLGDGELLAQTRSGATSYYLYDGQGSIRALADSTGAITDQYTYDAFGNALSSQSATVNPYRYTGQQLDSLTGLYDLRARYYDPTSGRFTSRDTAGIDFSNQAELNRYNYAQSNPINLSDPSGHGPFFEYAETNQITKPWERPVPPGVIVAAGLLLLLLLLLTIPGLLTNIQGLVQSLTQTQQKEQQSGEVLVDNQALLEWYRVIGENLLQGQDPVYTPDIAREHMPYPFPAGTYEVPDASDETTVEILKAIHTEIQPLKEGGKPADHTIDAKLGSTMLNTGRGLITFDATFCATLIVYDVTYVTSLKLFTPTGLRPRTPRCISDAWRYIKNHTR